MLHLKSVQDRVSNGTGQCNFSGQRDKLKILPWDGTGRDILSQSGTGHGTRQSLFFCQNLGQDWTIAISKCPFSALEPPFPFLFFVYFGKLFCPGTEGQAQNLAMGQDGPGQLVKIQDRTRDGKRTYFCPVPDCPVPWKP